MLEIPFRLERKHGQIIEKRSDNKGRPVIFNPMLDAKRRSKILKGRLGNDIRYAHTGDFSKRTPIQNTLGIKVYCPYENKWHSPKKLSNPLRCPNTNKVIGYI